MLGKRPRLLFCYYFYLNHCFVVVIGDVTRRLCTAAETRFYFDNLFGGSTRANYLRPNKNCNLSSWLSGCEPGWACSVGTDEQVDLRNSKVIPTRNLNCQPCCEGFFCPHGITCMIRKHYLTLLSIYVG